jgi:hypothetical protein
MAGELDWHSIWCMAVCPSSYRWVCRGEVVLRVVARARVWGTGNWGKGRYR